MTIKEIIDAERWQGEITTEEANYALDRIEDAVTKHIAELEEQVESRVEAAYKRGYDAGYTNGFQ